MTLDQIQQYYFTNKLDSRDGTYLLIGHKTFAQMQKEDGRMIQIREPDEDGNLPPLFGRPVRVVCDDGLTWQWCAFDKNELRTILL